MDRASDLLDSAAIALPGVEVRIVERCTSTNDVLLKNHGVFTIGRTPRHAVKAAVMCEDVARSVHVARQLGTPVPIEPADVDVLYRRYQDEYGQG